MSRDVAEGELTPEDDEARVQPRLGPGSDDVVRGWLRSDLEFASHVEEAEERLARLRGDADVLLALQLNDFDPSVWGPVGEELARYGFTVLMSWCRRGTILLRVHTLTSWQLPVSPYFTEDEQVGVVDDTVVRALVRFQTILRDGKWDPRKGASLTTYFTNQCLFRFAPIYRAWLRAEGRRRERQDVCDPTDDIFGRRDGMAGPEAAEELRTILADLKDRDRRAFLLREAGYSHAEIAQQLGYPDAKAVENMMDYQQRKIRRRARSNA